MQSRTFFVVCSFLVAIMCYIAWLEGDILQENATGILNINLNNITDSGLLSAGINFVFIILTAVITIGINKAYSFIRSLTFLFASLFILFVAANPALSQQWNEGSLVAVVAVVCMALLFSVYENRNATKKIFIIFSILSALSLYNVAFCYLIPLFLLGVVQMRAFSLRGFIAMLFGAITPYWIALGSGIISISDLHYNAPVSIFQASSYPMAVFGALGVSLLGIVALSANAFTLLKYKLRTRVYNGFILLLMFFSIIMIILDFKNYNAYFPLLNLTVAIQIGQFYASNSFLRRYIALGLIIIAIFAFFIWQLLY